jgi:hypothetical protein
MSGAAEYEIGYGRPPRETRFEKGRSGNPSGRPKGSRGVSTVIAAALSEKVVVNENGKRRTITKLEAAVKQMANKAAGGDQRAAKLIIELLHQSESRDEARAGGGTLTAEARKASDKGVLEAIRDQALRVVTKAPADE